MNCQQANPLIELYADGELEAETVIQLEQHIRGCPACARAWRNLKSLQGALKQDALYFTAPAELRRRIKSELPLPGRAASPAPAWNWNWLTTALSGALAACLALLLVQTQARPSADAQLAQEVVSSHIRSLMAGHAMDVASTDQHTVKPWFNGKLDFSPPVKDLASHEFPLVGGRLDYLGGRSVAALVFQRHNHLINLFVWPAKAVDSAATPLTPKQGYNLIHWSKEGMIFWAVSDLNGKELMEFARDFASE